MELKRGIHPSLIAEMAKPVWHPVVLLYLDWPSGPVRVHTGVGPLAFGVHLYDGLGKFGQINVPGEEAGLVPQEADLILTADYADLLSEMSAHAAGRRADLWLGATTTPGGTTLVGPPYHAFVGAVSGDDLLPPGRTEAQLVIRVRAGMHGRVSGSIAHTDEDHRSEQPGDDLFRRTARATAEAIKLPRW
jgi:hypothetical protein